MGACERILRTPIPLSYTRHTARFLMLYLTFLPFALWEQCKVRRLWGGWKEGRSSRGASARFPAGPDPST